MPPRDITRNLRLWRAGSTEGRDDAIALVYADLRRRAASLLRKERPGHTLSPTSLVHEAYLRLSGQNVEWLNRDQFFGVAGQIMRRILVDHARRRAATKRQALLRVTLAEDADVTAPARSLDLVALDEALERLSEHSERAARLVELRYFAGLTLDEASVVLGISPATASRDWMFAKAWLGRRIRAAAPSA